MKKIYFLLVLICLSASAFAQTTFNYTGSVQTFSVPAGVTLISVDMYGAVGGLGNNIPRGGYGGRVQCTLTVTPSTNLYMFVGGVGGNGGSGVGGFNGGGNGLSNGGGGGGASDIRTDAGGPTTTNRLVVAAGGGGGSANYGTANYDRGGNGGGTTGEKGSSGNVVGGSSGDYGGYGGTPSAGGLGGQYPGYSRGSSGTVGVGGNGASGTWGAGGGGGYYGGGGGSWTGGGGGSSYADATAASSVTHTAGFNTTGSGRIIVTVLCNSPGTITGASSVCVGSTTTLANPTSITGGTWSSSNTAIGTINSSTGVLTGISAGTTTITYSISNPCGALATKTITVNPLPASITGSLAVCIGFTSTLSNSSSGGTWSSSNTSLATVGSVSGIVTGVGAGNPTITYTLPTGCSTTSVATVNSSPASIGGSLIVCAAQSTTLTNATSGGTWSSSNTAVATIGSASGSVAGISGGTATITYTAPTGCYSTALFSVNAITPITGTMGTCNTGATFTLSNATSGGTWTSSNTSVATIGSVSGVVTSVSAGVSTITYLIPSSGCYATGVFGVTSSPAVYSVTGGGGFCAGGTGVSIGLSNTDFGVSYQVYNGVVPVGAPISGSGFPGSFAPITTAGTYTVVANAGSSCATTMSGSATIVVNALPTAYSVTGGGNFCLGGTGVNVGLSSSQIGVNYQLMSGTSMIGSPVAGTSAALNFGLITTPGSYTVVATHVTQGCVNSMSGSVTVATNALPTAYTITSTGTSYCSGGSGIPISLNGSETGVNYRLHFGGSPVGSVVSGTGTTISFGSQLTAGTYTIVATNATTGCVSNMTGSITTSVNPLPTVYSVTGGGAYCSGGTGVEIGLSGSQAGVNYQLYRGTTSIGTPVAGTGASLSFGLHTTAGSYTISATNGSTGCNNNMSGSANVSINPLPTTFAVTGGGGYCAGGPGVHVGLSGSVVGFIYQLYNSTTIIDAEPGTGSAIDFGFEPAAGFYTVVAVNATTGCTANMTGSATVVINPLPVVFTVTGGGSYCSGGTGVAIGLNGSNSGTSYQLYTGTTTSGSAVAGTNAAISFGNRTPAGSYTVIATTTSTGCTSIMLGSASVAINPLPTRYNVTGAGSYCAGGTGVSIGLDGSNTGINYQLFNGTSLSGVAMAGTGTSISFGLRTLAGTYRVIASNTATSCIDTMTNTPVISINPLPTAYNVLGGGSYCAGDAGVDIMLGNSATGVSYQLFRGVTLVGGAMAGTGSSIDFGFQAIPGTYTVVATNTTTLCTNNMAGSAVVNVLALPMAFTVTGGGNYCTGGAGVHIGLVASAPGISYQLYHEAVVVGIPVAGTGGALDFGLQTAPGNYTVIATNDATLCTKTMTGSATITADPFPALYTLTGGGNYCFGTPGVHIGLDGSVAGTNYTLYSGSSTVGAPIAGTGSPIDFGLQAGTGVYSITATNTATGCTSNMIGISIVNIDPLPTTHNVTGGGGYCPSGAGVHVGLNASNVGTNYQLYRGSTPVGSPVAGTGIVLDFGLQTVAGSYNVVATNTLTTCSGNMTGSVAVVIFPLPVTYNVTGTGNYCPGGTGRTVGLSGSNIGVSYQLHNSFGPSGSPMAGTGLPLNFGNQLAGSYTVVATNNSTACNNNMTGAANIGISPLPATHVVTGGGSYCAGATGVSVGLNGSSAGVSYQLVNGTSPAGSPMAGTGSALDFGVKTAAGMYTVIATGTSTTCTSNMTGSAVVVVNSLPVVYNVTGGGNYCTGGTGVHIMLSGSNTGINYQLYNGTSAVGPSLAGTGAALDFGLKTATGVYTVVGTNAATSCVSNMAGSAMVVIDALPIAYTVSGGGNYCSGGTGVHVLLSGSNTGVNYQLWNGSTAVGAPQAGTGFGLDFGLQTATGNFTVKATNATTGCVRTMTGSATIGINPLPGLYSVSSTSSNYCLGGTGVDIALTGSDIGINYQLYHAGTTLGTPLAGTGLALDFGNQLPAGLYTVVAINATTGCTRNMASSVTVVIDPLPNAFTMTGGGGYCNGGAGVPVGLSGSNSGIMYQLYVNGVSSGAPVTGTGSALNFGIQTATGNYTVVATNPATTCTNNMSGVATVGMNPLPALFTVTGGGSYCSGGTGVTLGVSSSQAGVSYQLYNGSLAAGSPVAGGGGAIDFGFRTGPGTYTVVATNTSTTCSNNMLGTAVVSINALPTAYPVTGGGNYCAGGAGVHVGIGNSQSGVNYQLYNGSTLIGIALPGFGSGIDFGLQTTAGSYTVVAENTTTGCTATMSGSATVGINPLPTLYNVTGGGNYCAGSGGVHIGMNSTSTGVSYQLFNGFATVGSAVMGTGATIDFGLFTVPATYTVIATNISTTCSQSMAGSATVTVAPTVVPFVTIAHAGGDTLCSGSFTAFTAMPVNGGTSPTYQWTLNGSVVGFGGTYSFTPANGDVVGVTLTSNATCATPATASNSTTLSVLPQGMPSVNVSANPGNVVCQGTAVNFMATPVLGGSAPTYNWIRNGASVSSSASFSYTPSNGDDIYCVVTSNYRCRLANIASSAHVIMTVDVPVAPTVAITANPGTNIAAGQNVTFTAAVTDGGSTPGYQWSVNGIQVPGATMPTFTTNTLTNMDVVACLVTRGGGCAGLTGTASATVHVVGVGVNTLSFTGSDIRLVPNPNKGNFIVSGTLASAVSEEISIEVTNMLGQVVYNSRVSTRNGVIDEQIQLGTVANGMYILSLRAGSEQKVFHMVVEQ